uniref:EF-hand domain-containing protein n=1 Tax=Magallana gigas TaxID=29159 RepID=A0A8W8MXB5_MAGGI
MLAILVFVVSYVVYGIDGESLQMENGAPLPCRFDAYDLNGNKAISVEEFLSATKGFTKMDRKILFERLDRNGDKVIGVGEFKYVPRSILKAGILNHCLRYRNNGCWGICWGI